MKRFVLAVTLTCVLFSTALAGIIPSTDAPIPQPSRVLSDAETNIATGDILTTLLSIISAVI